MVQRVGGRLDDLEWIYANHRPRGVRTEGFRKRRPGFYRHGTGFLRAILRCGRDKSASTVAAFMPGAPPTILLVSWSETSVGGRSSKSPLKQNFGGPVAPTAKDTMLAPTDVAAAIPIPRRTGCSISGRDPTARSRLRGRR